MSSRCCCFLERTVSSPYSASCFIWPVYCQATVIFDPCLFLLVGACITARLPLQTINCLGRETQHLTQKMLMYFDHNLISHSCFRPSKVLFLVTIQSQYCIHHLSPFVPFSNQFYVSFFQLGSVERSCRKKSRLSDAALRVPGQTHGQSFGLRRQNPTEF